MSMDPDNRPQEMTLKLRPAGLPNIHHRVAEYVADFCWKNGITEHMIQDIRMGDVIHGVDAEGSFSQVRVWFIYF